MTPELVETLPEFRAFTQIEILKHLADPIAANPVSTEVERLILGYIANSSATEHWPIEGVAAQMTAKAKADTFKQPGLSMAPKAIMRRALKSHSQVGRPAGTAPALSNGKRNAS